MRGLECGRSWAFFFFPFQRMNKEVRVSDDFHLFLFLVRKQTRLLCDMYQAPVQDRSWGLPYLRFLKISHVAVGLLRTTFQRKPLSSA